MYDFSVDRPWNIYKETTAIQPTILHVYNPADVGLIDQHLPLHFVFKLQNGLRFGCWSKRPTTALE